MQAFSASTGYYMWHTRSKSLLICHNTVLEPSRPLSKITIVKALRQPDAGSSKPCQRMEPHRSTVPLAISATALPVHVATSETARMGYEAPSAAIPLSQEAKKHNGASATIPRYSLMSPSWQPLAGVSKQHAKIEKQVIKAASSQLPVYISGDAGLNKLRLAATIHTLGLTKQNPNDPLVAVDCSTADGLLQAQRLFFIDSRASGAAAGCAHAAVDDSEREILEYLTNGTLVLENLHKAPVTLLQAVDSEVRLMLGSSTGSAAVSAQSDAAGASTSDTLLQALGTRLIFTSQMTLTQLLQKLRQPNPSGPALGSAQREHQAAPDASTGISSCINITVPPLRARASDIAPLALQAAAVGAELRGYGSVAMTNAAVMKLTGYQFPGNIAELEGLVQRAIMLHPAATGAMISGSTNSTGLSAHFRCTACDGPVLVLDEDDFWAATEDADRERVDVLELLPWLRPYMLDTQCWPQGLNNITTWLYPLIVASLFLGPQDREHSAALTVFWAGWWPLIMLSFPLVGRAWCAICPFMITGQQAQKIMQDDSIPSDGPSDGGTSGSTDNHFWRTLRYRGRQLQQLLPHGLRWQPRSWPSVQLRAYADWAMVAGFAAILLWEEVWDLPNTAYLSGWLLVLITAGAVGCSVIFERRLWCRALCPIGGMNGLFAKLAMTEIRSRAGLCAASACARPCHQGRWVASDTTITGAAAATLDHATPLSKALKPAPEAAAATATIAGSQVAASSTVVPGTGTASSTDSDALLLPGCPMNTRPGFLLDNHDCIVCGNCLRSCESGSAQWRLRPPAADLWAEHSAAWHELMLMYVLLGAVLLHSLPRLCDQLGLPADVLLGHRGPHLALSALLLAAPGAVAWTWSKAGAAIAKYFKQKAAADINQLPGAGIPAAASAVNAGVKQGGTVREAEGEVPHIKLAYSLLPLVWAGTLAHYEEPMMTELGLVLPRLATSLGAHDAAGWLSMLPTLGPAPAAVVSAAQGSTLVAGIVLSLALAGKIAEVEVGSLQAGEVTAAQRALILAMAAELWYLIV